MNAFESRDAASARDCALHGALQLHHEVLHFLVSAPSREVFQLNHDSAHFWILPAHDGVLYGVQELSARLGPEPRLELGVYLDELDDKVAFLRRICSEALTDDLAYVLAELLGPFNATQKH